MFASGFKMNVTYEQVIQFLSFVQEDEPDNYKKIKKDAMSHYDFEMDYLKAIESSISPGTETEEEFVSEANKTIS